MQSGAHARVVVTGVGVIGPLGVNARAFAESLREGRSAIARHEDAVSVPGRLLAKMPDIDAQRHLAASRVPGALAERAIRCLRRSSKAVQVSVLCAVQAWQDAGLADGDAEQAGAAGAAEESCLVVAGHNLADALSCGVATSFSDNWHGVPPSYALHFMDTDHVGTVSETLGIKGEGFCVGGASASGNVGIVHGYRLVASGEYPRCLVVGPMADLSPVSLHALQNAGALCDAPPDAIAARACRPFDVSRDGFVYGQAAGAIVLESAQSAARRGAAIAGEVLGGAMTLDANRLSNPNACGEARAMRRALAAAGVDADAVEYVNAHGTASPAGDDAEIVAIKEVFGRTLSRVRINATKALTGHCLWSAGIIEAIATLLQMREGFLHGNPNLETPIDPDCRFVGVAAEPAAVRLAVSNSFGFGGISSAIVLQR